MQGTMKPKGKGMGRFAGTILVMTLVLLLLPSVAFLQGREHLYRVVVHVENPIRTIPREKLKRIFTGKIRYWPDHQKILPIYLDGEHLTDFAEDVGLSRSDLQQRWVRLSLQGVTEPPRRFERAEDALAFLVAHPTAIGIFPSSLSETPSVLKEIPVEP
ncbi:MAG: hypothetical protein D6812_08755 [Deltaproteobacteria bacterium]|nr:MAG: hypothetical protein D6812_08755 [Deltaproteobacteria bacterium]